MTSAGREARAGARLCETLFELEAEAGTETPPYVERCRPASHVGQRSPSLPRLRYLESPPREVLPQSVDARHTGSSPVSVTWQDSAKCWLTCGFISHGFLSVPVSFHALAEQRRNWQMSSRA